MNKIETNSTAGILEIETTEAERQKLRERGVAEDDLPPPGARRYRRARHIIKPSDAKVRISIEIDGDVLQHFRQRAERQNAESYQAQINAELRKIMERELTENEAEIRKNIEFLTKDKEFIRAVAEQLKELQAA